MFNADEARRKSNDITNDKAADQLRKIEEAIDEATDEGKLVCYVYFHPMGIVLDELYSHGYSVDSFNARNETTCTISWEK